MGKYRQEPHILQREGKKGWTFQVNIKTDDGTITKSFSESAYRSAKIAFDSAIHYRDKTLYEIREGLLLKKNNSTVQDMFDAYLESTTDSYKTKRKHEQLFNKYILHKDTKIQELTRADVMEDLNKMVEIASDDTIRRLLSIWKNDIVGTALAKEIIVKDVTLGVSRPRSHMVERKRSHDTDRNTVLQMEGLILHYVRDKYDAQIIVYLLELLYYTGMRPAEAEVLTRDDIGRDSISINKELGSSSNHLDVVRRCKTPTSVREVPIHPELHDVLDELLEFSVHDNVFAKHDGTYMNSDWVGTIIARICRKEGIKFNLYRLRHNMATSLVTHNVDTKTTMELLGHANYGMSVYYATSNKKLKKDAIKLLS